MAANPIRMNTVAWALLLVTAAEVAAWAVFRLLQPPAMAVMGVTRLVQIAAMAWTVTALGGGLQAIGLSHRTALAGFTRGLAWSAGFGAVAGLGMGALYLSGLNPLMMLRSPLPADPVNLAALFLVGALIAPVAEEICFRGILYTYLRRWGFVPALIGSTALFAILHSVHGVPVIQITGGIVFAVAYETSRNLIVPITLHILGNLALFALSLPFFT